MLTHTPDIQQHSCITQLRGKAVLCHFPTKYCTRFTHVSESMCTVKYIYIYIYMIIHYTLIRVEIMAIALHNILQFKRHKKIYVYKTNTSVFKINVKIYV